MIRFATKLLKLQPGLVNITMCDKCRNEQDSYGNKHAALVINRAQRGLCVCLTCETESCGRKTIQRALREHVGHFLSQWKYRLCED